ncbi:PREDICTED: voltage-dependent T-type calcium channel subunit alpha-1H-like isoform X6 [Branchiostoma belcheri]|uniref:Voltage-dependent T-type calcium channel subunit alpha n=1 Tax=Branchiostoma belcheri TaxID=7741 RepID=A0A6P4ZZG3_BRABE|nr:PREDICTED: voltage-dependent T-type calcium channel subunit alpha-1H-like isoform X6 [Branchiostoma belcheri]
MSEPSEPTPSPAAPGGCDDSGSPESSADDPLESTAPALLPGDGQQDSSSESDDNKSTSSCEPERESSEEISAALSEEGKPVTASSPPRSPHRPDEIVPDPPTSGDESEDRAEAQDVQPYPELAPTAFCFLKQTHKPRLWCIKLISWPWFERLSMMVILLNCVTLGMYQPRNDKTCPQRCMVLQGFDHFIFAFFAAEMALKMIAMGIFGKKCYLGDTWNRLDAFIVLAGMVEYSLELESVTLSAIRTVRVLRPLRAINRVPSMRILVMLLLDTLPMLGNVLLLCFFVFFIFGILGVQLWAGELRNRCYLDSNITNLTLPEPLARYVMGNPYYRPSEEEDFICSKSNGLLHCYDIPALKDGDAVCNGTIEGYLNTTMNLTTNCINWNQYYTECKKGLHNPFKDAISFDNILYAWVAIFQVISLEGWVDIMYYIQDCHSVWNWVYFVILIVIGSFFMINLCLVVIATQFSETKQRESRLMEEQRRKYLSTSTLSSQPNPDNPRGCYEEVFKLCVHMCKRLRRRVLRLYHRFQGRHQRKVDPALTLQRKRRRRKKSVCVHHHHHHHHHHYHFGGANPLPPIESSPPKYQVTLSQSPCPSPLAPIATPEPSDVESLQSPSKSNLLRVPSTNGVHRSRESLQSSHSDAATNGEPDTTLRKSSLLPPLKDVNVPSPKHLSVPLPTIATPGVKVLPPLKSRPAVEELQTLAVASTKNIARAVTQSCHSSPGPSTKPVTSDPNIFQDDNDQSLQVQRLSVPSVIPSSLQVPAVVSKDHVECTCTHTQYDWASNSESEVSVSDEEVDSKKYREESVDLPPRPPGCWERFTKFMRTIVDSKYFNRGIMVAILVNTLSMGIEFHNQPEELTNALEISNLVFTSLFALEMLLKLLAYGPLEYIRNGFNVFDGIIVIVSIVEIAEDGEGGLSVLRTFRLMRILKLIRFLPALRRQLLVMIKTMDNVATFFALLILFIFIFSILGMHLFGNKFCEPDPVHNKKVTCDRKNFDTLLWALVTVFQILTQEDWNLVLYNGMKNTSPWAALYFIALMTFGNYVLFNLLVAILVEGFSAEQRKIEKVQRATKALKTLAVWKRPSLMSKKTPSTTNLLTPPLKEERKSEMDDSNSQLAGPSNYKMVLVGAARKDGDGDDTSPSVLNNERTLVVAGPEPPIITRTEATPQGSPNTDGPSNGKSVSYPASVSSQDDECTPGNPSALTVPEQDSPGLSRSGSRSSHFSWRRSKGGERESILFADDEDNLNDEVFTNTTHTYEEDGTVRASFNPTDVASQSGSLRSRNVAQRTRESTTSQGSDCSHLSVNSKPGNNGNNGNSPRVSVSSECNGGPRLSVIEKPVLTVEVEKEKDTEVNGPPDVVVLKDPTEKKEACPEQNIYWKCCPAPKGCFKTRAYYSLFLFAPENRLRQLCQYLVNKKWFDHVILIFIFMNCITLAMERPKIDPDSGERMFLTIANHVFTVIFTLEMSVKVLALGFVFGEGAYLKSGWNVIDGFLVTISLADTVIMVSSNSSPKIFGILRVFRLLRTLRPLRVISRAPGLKLVVQTLLSSLKPIGNIVLICCTFFVIFGILGVQLFKGKFFHCEGPDLYGVKNKTDCLKDTKRKWVNQKYNFDNLGQALMALFVLASKDGWVDIMYNGLDAVDIDVQPIENYNEWMIIFFISFLLLVGFFVLNMFVGVVVENFHKCREDAEREERLAQEERRRKKMERRMRREAGLPPVPEETEGTKLPKQAGKKEQKPVKDSDDELFYMRYSRPRRLVYDMITNKYFDLCIAAIIGVNVISMAIEHHDMKEELFRVLQYINYVFTAIFILEAALKITGLGFVRYIKERWNQLDMLIVILSIVGIVLEEMDATFLPINPTIIRIMRVLRIARVLKLLKMAKGIRSLLETVMKALPQVGNLGLLFFLLFFIFAALGVELFGKIDCTSNVERPCSGLGLHANFKNFSMALLTLFRIATGDNWNGIMKDTLRGPPDCDDSEDCKANCCVSAILAPIYFVSFVLMAQFVLVNVVVAVLMKNMEDSNRSMADDEEQDEEPSEGKEFRGLEDEQGANNGQGNGDGKKRVTRFHSLPDSFTFPVQSPENSGGSSDNKDLLYTISPSKVSLIFHEEDEKDNQYTGDIEMRTFSSAHNNEDRLQETILGVKFKNKKRTCKDAKDKAETEPMLANDTMSNTSSQDAYSDQVPPSYDEIQVSTPSVEEIRISDYGEKDLPSLSWTSSIEDNRLDEEVAHLTDASFGDKFRRASTPVNMHASDQTTGFRCVMGSSVDIRGDQIPMLQRQGTQGSISAQDLSRSDSASVSAGRSTNTLLGSSQHVPTCSSRDTLQSDTTLQTRNNSTDLLSSPHRLSVPSLHAQGSTLLSRCHKLSNSVGVISEVPDSRERSRRSVCSLDPRLFQALNEEARSRDSSVQDKSTPNGQKTTESRESMQLQAHSPDVKQCKQSNTQNLLGSQEHMQNSPDSWHISKQDNV